VEQKKKIFKNNQYKNAAVVGVKKNKNKRVGEQTKNGNKLILN